MASDNDALLKKLEKAIVQLDESAAVKEALNQIIIANPKYKRVRNFLGSSDKLKPKDYVKHVAEIYKEQHMYVSAVLRGDEEVWIPLYEKMQYWAYQFLLRCKFYSGVDTFELAVSYAGDAGAEMVNATYPYDVPVFDAWAFQLLKNVCCRNIKKATKQRLLPDNQLLPLEDHINLSDGSTRGVEAQVEKELALNLMHSHLNEREEIVLNGEIKGLSALEIATQLGTSATNVYKMKYDIIQKMSKIFQE